MRWLVHTAVFLLLAATAVPAAEGTPRACPGVCGDGVVDACEQCDLGAANCPPGVLCDAGCTSDCRVIGRCTGDGARCTTAAAEAERHAREAAAGMSPRSGRSATVVDRSPVDQLL